MSLLQLLENGELQQARMTAQLRLQVSAEDHEALLTLARLAAAEGRLEEADEILDGIRGLGPVAVQVRLTRLALTAAREQHEQAGRGYQSLLNEVPDLPEAIYGMASSLANQGLYEQALPHFQRLVELVPGQGRFHYHLGRNFLELDRPGEALESLAEALDLDPTEVDVYLVLSRTLSAIGQVDQARSLIEYGLQVLPDQPHLLNELANLQMLQGQIQDAAQSARRVAEARPDNLAAQANSALALLAQGRFAEAVEFCQLQEPKSSPLWAVQAAALEELEQLEEASQSYRQAARFADCDWNTLNNWGLLLLRLGRDAKAEKVLMRARRLAPLRPEPRLNLALTWARHSEGGPQALELLQELLELRGLPEALRDQALRLQRHLSQGSVEAVGT
ncbi:tetratricopeptide repeat protein [bacterium]|nr:tetratricopeptide repeat protein [bacterium]